MFLLMLLGAAGFWLRNRDILSDLYDYSSMIAAPGKIDWTGNRGFMVEKEEG